MIDQQKYAEKEIGGQGKRCCCGGLCQLECHGQYGPRLYFVEKCTTAP